MTAAVVLAAGASTRLGQPKQLVKVAGETLLNRALRAAREAGCAPIVAVLGASADRIVECCDLAGVVVVVNDLWSEGMASSIRLGVSAVRDADGVMLMTCDQPGVTPFHLRALMTSCELTASSYAGRRGVPAYFPAALFPELMKLHGDSGAHSLLRGGATVELPGGELDVDTTADLALAGRLFR